MSLIDPSCILIWNVRGLNSVALQHSARDFVSLVKVDSVCLQETNMHEISRHLILSMLGWDFDNNYIHLPLTGANWGGGGGLSCLETSA
jgi:exonuclease III